MPSATVEDYLKHIYDLAEGQPEQAVPMGKVAHCLQVVPGTATTMVKSLQREKWLDYQPRVGVWLTEDGRQEALRVLRKHRILEMFLAEVLGLDWTEVHEEAELLEHALSGKLVNRMDAFLGYPSVDPHGDPIPTEEGKVREPRSILLSETDAGEDYRIVRILRQESGFLQFLHQHGLVPEGVLKVRKRIPSADVMEVDVKSGGPVALGLQAAGEIRVKKL
jgi:DtxR family Mn-dependent transcriptional regulator